jgi:hypothetical protein
MESAAQRFVNFHNCGIVIEFATVVWSTENGHELSSSKELVAFLHNLVSPANQVEIMLLAERLNDVCSEDKGDSSVVGLPTLDLIRISPQQIAKNALVWHVLWSLHCINN